MILNVLLIVTIVTGMTVTGKINYLSSGYYKKEDGNIINVEDAELSGNEDLQGEFQNALEDILIYTLKTNCLKGSADINALLEKNKKELDEHWKNYSYRISYTARDGKEHTITNVSESTEELLELPMAVNYSGTFFQGSYEKEWRNLYKGNDTDYDWLAINYLISDICINNKKYAEFVSKEIVKHLDVYKDNILWMVSDEFGEDSKIYKKLYLENVEDTVAENYAVPENEEDIENDAAENNKQEKKETKEKSGQDKSVTEIDEEQDDWKSIAENNLYQLKEKELRSLYDCIYKAIVKDNIMDSYYETYVPLATIFGTPEKYNITLAVKEEYCNMLQEDYQKYVAETAARQKQAEGLTYVLFYDMVLFCLVMLALLYVCGRRPDSEEVHYLAIDRCYIEVTIISEAILFACLIYYADTYWEVVFNTLELNTMCVVPSAIIFLMTQLLFSMMRRIKGGRIFATSFIVRILKRGMGFVQKLLQSGKFVMVSVIIAVVAPVFYGLLVMFAGYAINVDVYSWWMIFLCIAFFLFCSWFVIVWITWKKTSEFETICQGVKKVKAGDIKYQIKINGSGMMHTLAEDINSLSDGLENAVSEMTKSERLKTELISNVSHDIKTPLTSIITYVDLLKKEDVQPEKAKEYIEVLDQKSQRLKYLTDDLFEAAKASSGAMSMELITLDVGSLVNQGIGEFAEKFEKSSLEVRNNVETERYFVKADGRLLWRVFENMLSNVSKYALAGSRVYIDVLEQKETIVLIVKNISAYELNISADELMERFTRGDRSRNTEGSGLGLNIAKSLAELQHGAFHVEIDGDLFKAVLTLPKSK